MSVYLIGVNNTRTCSRLFPNKQGVLERYIGGVKMKKLVIGLH